MFNVFHFLSFFFYFFLNGNQVGAGGSERLRVFEVFAASSQPGVIETKREAAEWNEGLFPTFITQFKYYTATMEGTIREKLN